MKYFADTYAIIAYLKGNKEYCYFFEKNEIITSKFNLMEVYYNALTIVNKQIAEEYYESFVSKCIDVSDETIKSAMRLRLMLKQQKLNISYVDAIGYQLSLENGIKFLTGDKEFKGMKNVEFVK
jgi:predicted nucleic acid-binding protein